VLLTAGGDRLGGRLLRDQGPEAADGEGPLPDDVDPVHRLGAVLVGLYIAFMGVAIFSGIMGSAGTY
jgi:hypothetical protein